MNKPALSLTEERALRSLQRALGSRVLTRSELFLPFETDDTGLTGAPILAVVQAESPGDLEVALKVAHETGVPITPRAAGTGRTGGAVPLLGGIVLCTKSMNAVVDIDRKEGTAVVGPGVILTHLHEQVAQEGWFYPPDPNSADQCCIGGNVAENAAGPRAYKYGSTRDYVLGLDAYLPGGDRFFSGRRTRKGVTGYDTTSLLVGSEGTLAVFGNIVLKLVPSPESVITILALFSSANAAALAVTNIVKSHVTARCIEYLDGKTLQIIRECGNALDARANALLLIEVDGGESECERQAEFIGNLCDQAEATSVLTAQSASGRASLWAARKNMSHAVRSRALHKISEDVVVPRSRLGELLGHIDSIEERHQIDALAYGHAGDGNLHVNFLFNTSEEKRRVDLAILELFQKTVALGGTLSGEHGIGLLKAPFLHLEQSPSQIALQRRLKDAFDPRGVMNPGKIFGREGHLSC